MAKTRKAARQSICKNRKARHLYEIDETLEAGIVLLGSEVKSLRMGRANLVDAYARVQNGELFLVKAHISAYEQAGPFSHEPTRERKLLLHRHESHRLAGRVREKGYTLVPLEMYFNEAGKVKVELALARGKHVHDKRRSIAERDSERRLRQITKRRAQGR